MLALLTPKDGGPERPLHVLVRENPDVSCTNCVSKGIRCTTNQIVNPAKPNKGGKRIEEAKKMFGSDGFQNTAPTPVPQPQARRASMPRSPSVATPGGSSGSSVPPNPPAMMPMFGGHQFNMTGHNGHPGPTASFVPPAPIPSPTVHPVHGWSAPPFDDWTGLAFEAQHGVAFSHPMHAPPNALELSTWETAIVVPPPPPGHAHSLPVLPSAMGSRSVPPPPLEPLFHSPLSPPLMTSSSSSTAAFLPAQSLTASPGVNSDACLPSQPPSRSDSGQSGQQPRVAGRKRTISEHEDDDVLELVRDDEPNQLDPSYMWAPRDKVMRYPQFRGLQEHPAAQPPRPGESHHRPSSSRRSFS